MKSITFVLLVTIILSACSTSKPPELEVTTVNDIDMKSELEPDTDEVIVESDTDEEVIAEIDEGNDELVVEEDANSIVKKHIRIVADVLNVRSEAMIESDIINKVYEYSVYEVLDEKTNEDNEVWFLIGLDDSNLGWVASWYCESFERFNFVGESVFTTLSNETYLEKGYATPYSTSYVDLKAVSSSFLTLEHEYFDKKQNLEYIVYDDHLQISYMDRFVAVPILNYLYGGIKIGTIDIDAEDELTQLVLIFGDYEPYSEVFIFDILPEDILFKKRIPYITAAYGDGLLYFWYGQLYNQGAEISNNVFYYDYSSNEILYNESIHDEEIVFDRGVFPIYSDYKYVRTDVYSITEWSIDTPYEGQIGLLKENDKFRVIGVSISGSANINYPLDFYDVQSDIYHIVLEDGTEGWIGGFHAAWD